MKLYCSFKEVSKLSLDIYILRQNHEDVSTLSGAGRSRTDTSVG